MKKAIFTFGLASIVTTLVTTNVAFCLIGCGVTLVYGVVSFVKTHTR